MQAEEEVSVLNLRKEKSKTAAAGSAQSRKDSTLGKLLNVERKECAQAPLKESEWISSKGIVPS